jgi:hypothetical protein
MGVGGFLELYLSYYAWALYGVLWDLFVHFGIVFIPFGIYLFEAFTDKRQRGRGKKVAEATLNQLKVKIILGLTVLTLAGVPMMPLSHSDYSYTGMYCNSSGTRDITQINGGGSTGTTYDSAFSTTGGSLFSSVKVPPWWWAVLNVSQAINDGFKVKIPCKASLTDIRYNIHASRITDPNLRQELAEFISSCYIPSVARFSSENQGAYTADMVADNDIGWIGSSFLLSQPGYYDHFRSRRPVEGFPYEASGREQGEATPGYETTYGRPTCSEWYSDSTNGLRTHLIGSIEIDVLTDIDLGIALLRSGFDSTQRQDVIIRSLIDVSSTPIRPGGQEGADVIEMLGGNQVNQQGTFGSNVNHVVATAGTAVADAIFYPTMYLVRQALPLVHAFILFGLVFLIPFLLILSQYDIEKTLAYSALLMSIKFWPSLWELGKFFESTLYDAMTQSHHWSGIGLATGSTIDNVLNYVMGAWYIIAPVLLTTVMTVSGFAAGRSLESASQAGVQDSRNAGKQGGSMATKAASKKMG